VVVQQAPLQPSSSPMPSMVKTAPSAVRVRAVPGARRGQRR
jgi:hypothetical protein